MTADLLHRHLPVLRYDSGERWFASSPALWTDRPGHGVRRAGGEAVAFPEGFCLDALALAGSRGVYPDGTAPDQEDRIVAGPRGPDRSVLAALQHDPRYADRILGRALHGGDGRSWLTYWFFYPYNDYTLLGPWIVAGRHEGDWEMIALRLDDRGEAPELALYAQHAQVEIRRWADVERRGERPVVYVARGCHASWFTPGRPWTGAWFDRADGRGPAPELSLEVLGEGSSGGGGGSGGAGGSGGGGSSDAGEGGSSGWVRWPGRWGATAPGTGLGARFGLDAASPHGPGHQRQWRDPAVLLR